jgi:hypothetical protein
MTRISSDLQDFDAVLYHKCDYNAVQCRQGHSYFHVVNESLRKLRYKVTVKEEED